MLKIPQNDRVENNEIFLRIDADKSVDYDEYRRSTWIAHILRHKRLLYTVLKVVLESSNVNDRYDKKFVYRIVQDLAFRNFATAD